MAALSLMTVPEDRIPVAPSSVTLPSSKVSPCPSIECLPSVSIPDANDEYMDDSYKNLLDLEARRMAQSQLPHEPIAMRKEKIAWLLDQAEDLPGDNLVAFRAMDYLDRYTSYQDHKECAPTSIRRQSIVLGAVLLIASKMESSDEFAYIANVRSSIGVDAISTKDIIAAELEVLKALQFELETATVPQFIGIYARKVHPPLQFPALTLAAFLCDQTLGLPEFYTFRPSMIALACIYLAVKHTTKNCTAPDDCINGLLEPFHHPDVFSKCVQTLEPLRVGKRKKRQP